MASDDAISRRRILRDISGGLLLAAAGPAGEPAELAPLYVLLAENRATYSTGQIFGATGGMSGP
jgi:NAD(P)-dependent dehydrogenase (short-subunit alcohol dehydrogenase family)